MRSVKFTLYPALPPVTPPAATISHVNAVCTLTSHAVTIQVLFSSRPHRRASMHCRSAGGIWRVSLSESKLATIAFPRSLARINSHPMPIVQPQYARPEASETLCSVAPIGPRLRSRSSDSETRTPDPGYFSHPRRARTGVDVHYACACTGPHDDTQPQTPCGTTSYIVEAFPSLPLAPRRS